MNETNTSDPFTQANIQKADAFLAQFIDIKQLLPIKEGLTKEMIEYFNQFKFSTQLSIGPLTYQERQKKIQKYRQKKNNRQFTKKNHYDYRVKKAKSRQREKGRFISNKK
ncbi:unnamed protein product (macronuclear) [Paramecium tetraurelia]|uniref:CCT domain-containing protein n=1 Tax=Paramecium tetraurelia TaxID=5888 RepID=A0DK97_PARTE|nr:uncharacterized protein GSPATT00017793001 [Paramecium tetraurelia]CAK83464.1 unnamed protein product [Paramecium tetraurelia]|eukprot:XP_001450861.1 hypothetical protein (macronuclear) [Paramecium tetraurelia strain d4-2]